MKGFSKKALTIVCVVAMALTFATVFGAGTLTVTLGTLQSNPSPSPTPSPTPVPTPAAVSITSATFDGITAIVANGGQSASFTNLPAMEVGDTSQLSIIVHNTGQTHGQITGASVAGLNGVFTATIVGAQPSPSTPFVISPGQSLTFIWNIEAVAVGTATPSVSFTWS